MAFIDQEVRRLVGKAIHHYGLIEDGETIVVAVSGGKDSMLLLWLLRERLSRLPIRYDLVAVHVDPGFETESAGLLEDYFKREGFRHEIIRTDHGVKAHGPENRENPCFLCARLRRTTLFKKAHELGCRKLAFGHNQDDFIETFFINICYGAQVAAMLPKQEFFNGEVTVIRPLALVPAEKVERLSRRLNIPVIRNGCPSSNKNKRMEIRTLLDSLYRKSPKVRGNVFHAMSHVNLAYLPPPLNAMPGSSTLLQTLAVQKDGS
ncbi:ATP-binding protein [Desulforhabdus amnigena]|uniref:Adenine nucleotide alpha hydrolase n=1 Tax=Desulforhabdus amnigena TaxID=40218 RepID=A0A9W6D207_9BACT|nr:ATP-binding protein [Desulforhabdus amnigena]NLJ27362.1 tRNA 2-thiocytidine(32) synthetase TtcA [Deltaproteobacteria bacterium]GLI34717.1 adenine nucleotide alpha hydrolase [Desulforhabdus amnigena]